MLLEAPALGALGVAGDIPENASILPQGYVEPLSLDEEVRSRLLIRYRAPCGAESSDDETEAFQEMDHRLDVYRFAIRAFRILPR
jgi:hypothetical protein